MSDKIEHRCLSCCDAWNNKKGICSNRCKHEKGKVCEMQKRGLKLPLSEDELPLNYKWGGFLSGSYFNTYILALISLQHIKITFPIAKIIKVKTKSKEINFKIIYRGFE